MSSRENDPPDDEAAASAPVHYGPGLASDRTALAWTRSALNIAATGALLARAAFNAGLGALGVLVAIATALVALLVWRRGQLIYRERTACDVPARPQARAFELLTTATLVAAIAAVVVTVSF